ncbi:hypothetical protein ACLOJK_027121 [Asimina triloba]
MLQCRELTNVTCVKTFNVVMTSTFNVVVTARSPLVFKEKATTSLWCNAKEKEWAPLAMRGKPCDHVQASRALSKTDERAEGVFVV